MFPEIRPRPVESYSPYRGKALAEKTAVCATHCAYAAVMRCKWKRNLRSPVRAFNVRRWTHAGEASMPSWLEEVAGPNFAPAVLWTLLALVVLVIVLVVVRIVRSMTFGTFVVGGRNRKTRLAVMDAAAVDSQRRLVLVRRDDIEHLILIGGPTDVVVERD